MTKINLKIFSYRESTLFFSTKYIFIYSNKTKSKTFSIWIVFSPKYQIVLDQQKDLFLLLNIKRDNLIANIKVFFLVAPFNFADEEDCAALLGTKIALFCWPLSSPQGGAMIMNLKHRKFTISQNENRISFYKDTLTQGKATRIFYFLKIVDTTMLY